MQETWDGGFNPWIKKIPWRKAWQSTPVFLPGGSHGQRGLESYRTMGLQRGGHDWRDLACMHACYLLMYDIYNPFIRFIVACLPKIPVKFHESRVFFWFIFVDLFQTPSTLPGTKQILKKQLITSDSACRAAGTRARAGNNSLQAKSSPLMVSVKAMN